MITKGGQCPLEERTLRGLAPRTCLGHYISTIATFSCRISPTTLERHNSLLKKEGQGPQSTATMAALSSAQSTLRTGPSCSSGEKGWEPLLKSSLSFFLWPGKQISFQSSGTATSQSSRLNWPKALQKTLLRTLKVPGLRLPEKMRNC